MEGCGYLCFSYGKSSVIKAGNKKPRGGMVFSLRLGRLKEQLALKSNKYFLSDLLFVGLHSSSVSWLVCGQFDGETTVFLSFS